MQTGQTAPSKDEVLSWYDEEDRKWIRLVLESKNKSVPRAQEIIEFAKHAGYTHVGIAHCVAVADQAAAFEKMLAEHFKVTRVECKVFGLQNEDFVPGAEGPACEPAGQAKVLAEAGTQFNVVMGLCLGHDLLFQRHAAAPSTTLVVKDRVLGHNPVAALEGKAE